MAFTQKLPVWLAPGVEPPEVLKNEGWKAGIKPPDAYFNYLQNTAYLALKELQEKAVEASALAGKVDKEPGKGLSSADFTTAEKAKLAGIQAGATNYQHPATHPATMITEDATHRFVTDAEKTNWNGKETPAGAQQKVDILAGPGNTKTVKQLDDAFATHSADDAAHGIGSEPLETTAQTLRAAINETKAQADAAFTSASNGKGAVGAAITGVDPAVVIPPEPTFNDLAGAIGQISTGKKWASGVKKTEKIGYQPVEFGDGSTINTINFFLTVTGLEFKPSIIILNLSLTGYFLGVLSNGNSYQDSNFVSLFGNQGIKFIKLSGGTFVTDSSFQVPFYNNAFVDINWIAIE